MAKNQLKSGKISCSLSLSSVLVGQTLIAGRSLGNDVGLKPGAT